MIIRPQAWISTNYRHTIAAHALPPLGPNEARFMDWQSWMPAPENSSILILSVEATPHVRPPSFTAPTCQQSLAETVHKVMYMISGMVCHVNLHAANKRKRRHAEHIINGNEEMRWKRKLSAADACF